MNLKNTEYLLEKYPKIFSQHKLPPSKTAMCWLFECGDGWFWLIDNLCNTIQRYINDNKKKQVEAVQVKEKYGTLRFYTNTSDDLIDGMVWLAEAMSAGICEQCGSTVGVKATTGWISHLCPECTIMKEEVVIG